MRRIYLDYTATTPLDPRVFDAMRPYMVEQFGNASSIHGYGREVRAALDISRESIAGHLGAAAGTILFTSGGTESDNFALKGVAWKMREEGKNLIVTSAIEHHAVLESCAFLETQGFLVSYIAPDRFGMIHPEALEKEMRPGTGLVSIIHANNEIGTINHLRELAAVAHRHGALFHSDAVQSFGKLPIDIRDLDVDLLTVSGHKIYGPKGIGVLYIRKGVKMERLIHGGGQERGRRAGTENVALAVGFARAADLMIEERESEENRLKKIKKMFGDQLLRRFPEIQINGHPAESLSQILNISFNHEQIELDGEALLFNLDLAGIAVTSGSACASGTLDPSHVLLAMGVSPKTAKATIRFSMGKSTTEDELNYTMEALGEVVERIGRRRR